MSISSMQSLLSDHAPSELMQCLCSLTVEVTSHLSAATSDVDLARDAKLLRWAEPRNKCGIRCLIRLPEVVVITSPHIMY